MQQHRYKQWDPCTQHASLTQPLQSALLDATGALCLPECNVAQLRHTFTQAMAAEPVSSPSSSAAALAKIGVGPSEPFVNPASRTSGLTYVAGRGMVPSASARPSVLNDAQISQLADMRGAVAQRKYPGSGGTFTSILDAVFGGLVPTAGQSPLANLEPPKLIAPSDMLKWNIMQPNFPVGLYYPAFPVGRVTGFLKVIDSGAPGTGLPMSQVFGGTSALYYRVQKMLPLGQTVNEPYATGQWMVPASATYRVPLATVQILPEYDTVTMLSAEGDQFPVSYMDYVNTHATGPNDHAGMAYDWAKRLVILQYPEYALSLFGSKNLAQAPAKYDPSPNRTPDNVPEALRRTPAILVPQMQTEE